ncbi:DinB family protein [Dyadobacter sandarakinus]|uniref:DinB family protein n=1 Tax=Dyadobacter sandarakinus TaxID=2747268 RepID=A0ABX7I1M3_9BACT|nr:DinB family protein [Dyadobacter sandarakinus]QRQ99592.1 DinB family protein [Dyadobacter sandarakinus]
MDKQAQKQEVWLRGPLPGVPPLLQPAAHALLQAGEELAGLADTFPNDLLWHKPAGLASVGFHLQHLTGVLDRLFTYADERLLSDGQLTYLKNEGSEPFPGCNYTALLHAFDRQVEASIAYFKMVEESTLTDLRYVGRARIPSTKLGLLFHAAEHTQRHTGQLLVTARMLMQQVDGIIRL